MSLTALEEPLTLRQLSLSPGRKQQLQAQINQIDGQLQQLDMQGQGDLKIQKQSLQPLVRRPYNKLKTSSSRSIKRKVNC